MVRGITGVWRWGFWPVLGAVLAAVLASCAPDAGAVYQAAQPATLDGGATASVQIYANGDWRDTGIDLVQGQPYRFDAIGRWSSGGVCGYTDASGAGAAAFCAGDPWGIGVGGSTLIGRIGTDGRPFGVGTQLTMSAPASGRLYLRDYDLLPFDNLGFQNVTITQSSEAVAADVRDSAGASPAAGTPIAAANPPAPQQAPPAWSPPQGPTLNGRRVALVVGQGAYQHVPQLRNPPNDARLMAQTLRAAGFVLIGGGAQLDLDKAGFDRAIQTFGQQIQNADVAWFYYAGHGLQVSGVNWLVPVSANPTRAADLDFQMENAGLVLKQMQQAGTKLNIVLLDACRNNPFHAGRGLRAVGGGLAQMQAPQGTLISYATQPGSVAQDGGGGNSPYTTALARAIRTPSLDIFRLFNRVGLDVKQQTGGSQLPWVSNSPISGDFYFKAG